MAEERQVVPQVVATSAAPAAIGPYSQAVRVGDWVHTSGQIALDPQSMQLVGGGVADQTRQVMRNLSAVLEEAGGSLASIVKTNIYMTDLGRFQELNEVYAEFFPNDPPARATVGVSALPAGAEVEIEVIAWIPTGA
ncbi:MAG: RidA family protein [Planctomycetota bacterium]